MGRKYLTLAEEREIEALTLSVCREHLPDIVTPVIKWNYSRNSLGLATFGLIQYRDPIIAYSRPLLARTYHSNRVETVYHEVSHLVVFYQFARLALGKPNGTLWNLMRQEGHHGPAFRSQMIKFGYINPKGV